MTNQQIFNKVAKHLLKQNKKSITGYECRYRDNNGLKCAIGGIIPDNMYCKEMEAGIVSLDIDEIADSSMMVVQVLVDILGPLPMKSWNLLMDLQSLHDRFTPGTWKDELNDLAKKYKLKGVK